MPRGLDIWRRLHFKSCPRVSTQAVATSHTISSWQLYGVRVQDCIKNEAELLADISVPHTTTLAGFGNKRDARFSSSFLLSLKLNKSSFELANTDCSETTV